jgi:hypothetical protein
MKKILLDISSSIKEGLKKNFCKIIIDIVTIFFTIYIIVVSTSDYEKQILDDIFNSDKIFISKMFVFSGMVVLWTLISKLCYIFLMLIKIIFKKTL